MDNIIEQIKQDEGFRPDVYIDTVGKRTVGYGHNLDANPLPDITLPLSEQNATLILNDDVQRITETLCQYLPWHDRLDDCRFGVLQNMAFNMGVVGLLQFHHMLAYLYDGDFSNAMLAGTQSKWYTQVGDRAKRLMIQLQTGVWQ